MFLLIAFACGVDCFLYSSGAVAILDKRQKRAEELKRLTDKSASMSEEQLTELRADIKVWACIYTYMCPHVCIDTVNLSFSSL